MNSCIENINLRYAIRKQLENKYWNICDTLYIDFAILQDINEENDVFLLVYERL